MSITFCLFDNLSRCYIKFKKKSFSLSIYIHTPFTLKKVFARRNQSPTKKKILSLCSSFAQKSPSQIKSLNTPRIVPSHTAVWCPLSTVSLRCPPPIPRQPRQSRQSWFGLDRGAVRSDQSRGAAWRRQQFAAHYRSESIARIQM